MISAPARLISLPTVHASGPGSLMNGDLAESGEQWGQPAPKPLGHDFNGRIAEARDFV